MNRKYSFARRLSALIGAIALAVALSGCVVVPERGGYYHPYRYGYYAY